MIYIETGKVLEIIKETDDLLELEVQIGDKTEKAIYYVESGFDKPNVEDYLLLNTTAVRLGLGTGGFHFVLYVLGPCREPTSKLTSPNIPSHQPGHMMKMRYTPLQRKMLAVEEQASPYHATFHQHKELKGMPVLIGELHSMLPIAACWLVHRSRQAGVELPRIAYIMTDGGALPIGFSSHVRQLKQSGWLKGTVTYGHAYGGDLEALNKYTALIAAKWVLEADAAIVCMGPGIAGTATPFGHTGMEVGEIINAVRSLNGEPILLPRISFADQRDRHQGLSHHTEWVLRITALSSAHIPLCSNMNEEHKNAIQQQLAGWGVQDKHLLHWCNADLAEVEDALSLYPEPIKTMGRGFRDDPAFFSAVCAAAQFAWSLIHPSS